MKYLGIDYGERNVGIAVSDEEGILAFPKDVLDNDKNLFKKIFEIIKDEKIETIILGKSLDFKKNNNPIMDKIISFKGKLEGETDLPVLWQEEMFTSAEADKIQGLPLRNIRKKDRKEKRVGLEKNDASAAALILRSYLANK